MKVYIIDDHALFRNGLISLLESRKISARAAASPEQGLEEIPTLILDIILLDLRMPGMSGIEVLKILKDRNEKTPIIMLTTSTEERDLRDCLKYGAQAYLLKDMDPDELVDALNEVAKGSIVVAQDMTHVLAKVLKNELPTMARHLIHSPIERRKWLVKWRAVIVIKSLPESSVFQMAQLNYM